MNEGTNILAVFGSTGSIGRNTLEVVRRHPEHFAVRYLTGNSNAELLIRQIREFRPIAVAVTDSEARRRVRDAVDGSVEVLDESGFPELAGRDDYDTMVSSLVGFAGLRPTVAAIQAGRNVALANKETLVVAGEIMTALCRRHHVQLTPIDSEHSAILQCIAGEPAHSIARIILTASGGPFRGRRVAELETVTAAEALKHPNWTMGNKISIDSATLMNKGLEVIEAHWLFGVDADRIDVVVHPQSIIHSMVEFSDGSVKAQLGVPDMKIPIHYALTWPNRIAADYERVDMARVGTLTFEEPDHMTFPCLRLAYDALRTGGTAPAILNAANEIGVAAFLAGTLPFPGIAELIEESLARCPIHDADTLEAISEADRTARDFAEAALPRFSTVHTTIR
ncbi:MAG: 1-deoxy-D-xylulose-5-phosphate reductoisomerase [Bacteroidetes bacterium]|nr:1-deoxy-D-xylulose-5-phosphate reductoisomerase [Bacteroidota bacterium]